MHMRFYHDPTTGEPHIYNHSVTEEEVEAVIRRPGEDRRGREGARVPMGKHGLGGACGASMCQTPSQTVVITAYELRGKPLMAYRRRQRRRGQR